MAGRIPQHFIDELIARADVVEVIGSRVQLKKAGREYKACCPFHDEKTPSFTVSPAKQFYHCFGCGAHGTALGFLMEYDHMSFVEAVEDLAATLGVPVPREAGGEESERHDALYELLEQVAGCYVEQLKADDTAKDYLRGRGLSGEIARDYRLGFATDQWDRVLRRYGTSAPARQRLAEAGLLVRRDDGREYDRFRHRIMFPIRDGRGRVIGFGGRVLGAGEPKYLNSPETPLFQKGRELYGLYEARRSLREILRLLVVEGYMDVIGLAEHGLRYAVATLGTATTPEHLRRLFRVCNEVVFCFDGDRAGRQAAWRALENALPELRRGRQVRFLFLPEGEDPDSLVRSEGREAFEGRIAAALPLSDYLLDELTSRTELASVDGRARLAELARPYLERVPIGVYRELLTARVAELVGMPAGRLAALLSGSGDDRGRADRRAGPGTAAPAPAIRSGLLRRAVTLCLHYPETAASVPAPAGLEELDIAGIDVLRELLELCRGSPHISTAGILEQWRDRPEAGALARLAATESLVDAEAAARELDELLTRLARDTAPKRRTAELLDKAATGTISDVEKAELRTLLQRRNPTDEPGTN